MLDGLERVPWRELHHAYGTAEDVPDLIRDLVAGDRERQKVALYELFGNIWHQGTVYEATSHAVPYLVEIALHPNTEPGTRDGVVGLLACIADGSSYLDVHRHLLEETVNEGDVEQELRWVREAHEAVRRRIPDFLATLALNRIRVPRLQLQS